jgi:hypothetical protein
MKQPDLKQPDMPADHRAWRDYVLCLCTARVLDERLTSGTTTPARLRQCADYIYETSAHTAMVGLDAIKKVMEIDRDVTNPATVLWRAGIEAIGAHLGQGSEPKEPA